MKRLSSWMSKTPILDFPNVVRRSETIAASDAMVARIPVLFAQHDGRAGHRLERVTFDQIIQHYNALLDGFNAGSHSVRVIPLDQIRV